MARLLAVYYSQSGQLEKVMQATTDPLLAAGHTVETLCLEPEQAYAFPWPFWKFLDVFPECVGQVPPPLKPWSADGPYDAVLLFYTVWFLSPAPPITAFLQSDAGRSLLKDTPVLTFTACRNMWVKAQEAVQSLLAAAGAKHCDHVALTDPGPSMATFITTPRWMLTGRRDALWGMPPAGIPDADIQACGRFGRAVAAAAEAGILDGTRPVLTGLQAAQVDPALLASEKIGRRSFGVWGKLVRAAGAPGEVRRRPVLALYVVFLILMIVTVVPLSILVRSLLRPLLRERLQAEAARYELPSGRDAGRRAEFG